MSSVVRAAFDVGSGACKLSVAEVERRNGQILDEIFWVHQPCLFGHDLKCSADGSLSEEIMERGFKILAVFAAKSKEMGAEEFAGVATAVFRKATNGQAFIDRVRAELGIPLSVVSQEEEGLLGFRTAVAASGLDHFGSTMDAGDVVMWDSGGASFQIVAVVETQPEDIYTTGYRQVANSVSDLDVYLGPIGASNATAIMVEEIQGKSFRECQTANPATIAQARELVTLLQAKMPPPEQWLVDAIHRAQVVCIGGDTSVFNIAKIALGRPSFGAETIWFALETLVGQSDEQLDERFPEAEMVIPKLVLVYSVMKHLGITEVRYYPTNGSCHGLLSTPKYWPAEEEEEGGAHGGEQLPNDDEAHLGGPESP